MWGLEGFRTGCFGRLLRSAPSPSLPRVSAGRRPNGTHVTAEEHGLRSATICLTRLEKWCLASRESRLQQQCTPGRLKLLIHGARRSCADLRSGRTRRSMCVCVCVCAQIFFQPGTLCKDISRLKTLPLHQLSGLFLLLLSKIHLTKNPVLHAASRRNLGTENTLIFLHFIL